MRYSDVIALVLLISFGIWWVCAPRSVIRFYSWFHGGKVRVAKPNGIRIIRISGLLWIALVIIVFVISFGISRR
jgi:hypothetical protein